MAFQIIFILIITAFTLLGILAALMLTWTQFLMVVATVFVGLAVAGAIASYHGD